MKKTLAFAVSAAMFFCSLALQAAAKPYFELLSLKSGKFGSKQPNSSRAWLCLARKRSRAGPINT